MDKFARFEAWLRENGAKFNQLELRQYDEDKPLPMDEAGEEKKEPATSSSQEDSEMRGVHAINHIPPNTVCMVIPRRCLITVEMGQSTPIGQAIMSSDLDLDAPKHIFLMVYILWDRKVNGENSFFHPYYEILPKTLKNMPIFWTDEELANLQGSYLLHQIADRNAAIEEDYQAICQIAPLDKICTLNEFKWARMCVCSRNFGLQIDGHRTSALVPHADMLNHYRPRETKWTFDEERQGFTITTLQHIQAGSEVFDSYGQKCNHRFLLNYGFAVEDNRELDGFCPNEVPIELSVSDNDPLFAEKLEFWTRGEVPFGAPPSDATRQQDVVKRVRLCVSNNENTRLLFSFLRALACNDEELRAVADHQQTDMTRSLFGLSADMRHFQVQNYQPHHSHNLHRHMHQQHPSVPGLTGTTYHRSCRDIRHPINLRNERAAMRLLLQILDKYLRSYPTTLQQDCLDLQDLQAFPRFSNRRHAKIQVRGEKEVLHHFVAWARTSLEVLDVIEDELNQERGCGTVEVRLVSGHRTAVDVTSPNNRNRIGFDYIIRHMEDDESVHHTILRYCADVLGSLRREEFKAIRRQQRAEAHSRAMHNADDRHGYV